MTGQGSAGTTRRQAMSPLCRPNRAVEEVDCRTEADRPDQRDGIPLCGGESRTVNWT